MQLSAKWMINYFCVKSNSICCIGQRCVIELLSSVIDVEVWGWVGLRGQRVIMACHFSSVFLTMHDPDWSQNTLGKPTYCSEIHHVGHEGDQHGER